MEAVERKVGGSLFQRVGAAHIKLRKRYLFLWYGTDSKYDTSGL